MKNTSFLLFFALAISGCSQPPTYKGTTKVPVAKTTPAVAVENVKTTENPVNPTSENAVATAKPEATEAAAPVIVPSCDTPASLKTDTVDVLIPKNDPKRGGKGCPFGKDDNNSLNSGDPSGKFTARIERRFDIAIPAERQVCGLEAAAPSQRIEYDDHLFLTLNNFVLMASRGIPTGAFKQNSNQFFEYSWAKIRGTKESGNSKCARGTTCELPASETVGTLSFKMDIDSNKRLFSSLAGKPLFFTMVLTGDDDRDVDCAQKQDITLKVTYTYIQK